VQQSNLENPRGIHEKRNVEGTFSEEIVNSSEVLGPIIYFVLRNGLAYAFFAAMKDKGNWPFSSEKPLAVESFRLSAMIAF